MKQIRTLIIIIAVFAAIPAFSITGNLFISGLSPESAGRGGTGVSAFGAADYYLNSASLSLQERLTVSAQYGSLSGGYNYPGFIIALPTSYGVFAGEFRYLSIEDGDEEYAGYSGSAGFGKELVNSLYFGIAADFIQWDGDLYTGLRPGLIFSFGGSAGVRGWGFYSPSIGLSASLGYGSGEADFNSVTGGYSFVFYRAGDLAFSFYNDLSVFDNFSSYPVKFGIESSFMKNYVLRGGFITPGEYDYMAFTAGAGYRFSSDVMKGSVDYALIWSADEGVNHHLGATVEYGRLDREAPEISIRPDYNYISPNYDGVQDYLIFDVSVYDRSRIKGWRLQIVNDKELTVRDFRMSERDIEKRLGASSFFRRIFSSRESFIVPERILWEGSDSSGQKLPDGRYRYYFYAWDTRDNIAPVKSGTVFLDATPPDAGLTTDSLIFSPNGDGNKDFLVIKQTVRTSDEDQWSGEFKNSAGETVRSFRWRGDGIPPVLTWDGKDGLNKLLPPGLYYYSLSSTDKAGNSAGAEVKEIILTTAMEIADVRPSADFYSYVKDGRKGIRFFTDLSDTEGLVKWEVVVKDDSGDPVRRIGGGSSFPGYVDWDCLDDEGENLDDGIYTAEVGAWFASGNNPVSFPKRIVFDRTPPDAQLSHSPEIFSPDDDGENDYLNIRTGASDDYGIENWELTVYNQSGLEFKKFSGTGNPPRELKWDGVGKKRELVESASDYTMKLIVADLAGNKCGPVSDKISVDVLVIVTERGLKIRISNIEFGFASSGLRKKGRRILDRVYKILQRYEKYDVIIEGHTDDVGTEAYNLGLSEKRALAVKKYLVNKGSDPARLKSIGMGESMPFYPNRGEENRRRNRRVEFLLIKKDK